LDSNTQYSDFLSLLDQKLVTEAKIINRSQNCSDIGLNWEDIIPVEFPAIQEGCQCDGELLTQRDCSYIRSRFINNQSFNPDSQTCLQYGDPNFTTKGRRRLQEAQLQVDPEYYPSYLEEDYQYPGFGTHDASGNLINDNTDYTKAFNTVQLGERVVPANDIGDPLDLIEPQVYPKSCSCLREVKPMPARNISLWEDESKLCVLRDPNWSTMRYLQSIDDFRDCKIANKCQKYFCKKDNETCPLIDIWLSRFDTDKGKDLDTVELFSSIDNSKDKLYGAEYMDHVFLPMIDLRIAMKGACSEKGLYRTGISFSLLEFTECSPSQREDILDEAPISEIMNANGNLFDELMRNIPLLQKKVKSTSVFVLESSHVFYRKSLTCFMKKKAETQILLTTFTGISFTDSSNPNLTLIKAVLFSFTTIDQYFSFQGILQRYVLVVNGVILFFSVLSILVKIYSACQNEENDIMNYYIRSVIYVTFIIDVSSAGVGGYAYFQLKDVVKIIDTLIGIGCLDDFSISKLYAYTNSLDQTAEMNFQVFLVIIFKLFFSVFSFIFYYTAIGRRLSAMTMNKIFYETISEGEPWDEDGIKVYEQLDMLRKENEKQ